MEERYTDKLARYILIAAALVLGFYICKLLSNVLFYILGAAVVALIGHPVSVLLGRIRIFRKQLPGWLISVVTIIIVAGSILGIVMLLAPIFTQIAMDISRANIYSGPSSLQQPLANINRYLRETFSALGPEFRIEDVLIKHLSSLMDVSTVTNLISGIASFLASFGVALFSVVFISFFFIKDPELLQKMIVACFPDRFEDNVRKSTVEIGTLISRYFSGLAMEVLGVGILNFIWMYFIARMGLSYSLAIAFMTAILNIVPYVGPLAGEVIGTVLAVTIKFAGVAAVGPDVSLLVFIFMVLGLLFATQLIDNFVFQPFIYSSSIKAHPLEIFIVLLVAGRLAGAVGILVAIPSYTVLRVIAINFFSNIKAVRELTK